MKHINGILPKLPRYGNNVEQENNKLEFIKKDLSFIDNVLLPFFSLILKDGRRRCKFFFHKRSNAWFSDPRPAKLFVEKSSDPRPVNIVFWKFSDPRSELSIQDFCFVLRMSLLAIQDLYNFA